MEFTPEQIEDARKLFLKPVEFMLSVAKMDQLPDTKVPEIAFTGLSNVGKSSLINALVSKTDLARTSNTPGRTQLLNFFEIDQKLRFVDMPGYGFAKAPPEIVAGWKSLVTDYLKGRPNLRKICLLIDSRHGLKKTDIEIMNTMDKSAVVYYVVLTKADKNSAKDLEKTIKSVQKELSKHTAAYPEIFVTSSEKKTGLELLRAQLAETAFNRA